MLKQLFHLVSTELLLVLISSIALSQTRAAAPPIGPSSVFHFKDTYGAELAHCRDDDTACYDAATRRFEQSAIGQIKRCDDDDCAAGVMRRFGASEEAIAFARQFGFAGFMTGFVKPRRIGVATVYFPGSLNDGTTIFLVNGVPRTFDVAGCGTPDPDMRVAPMRGLDGDEINCLATIDITRHPLYKSLARKVSDETGALPLMIWYGHARFQGARLMSSGGERLIVAFDLLRCHACKLAGYADVSYDFDSTDRFIGTTLLRLRKKK
jgi:hypothetical protein